MRRFYIVTALLVLPFLCLHAQLTVNHAATVTSITAESQCYQLTPASLYQKGSAFSPQKVNLNQNFEVVTKLYFGQFNDGADGIAFVFQRESPNYIGNYGAAMGYARFNGASPSMPVDVPGPVPSFIIEFDTWQNGEIYGLDVADPAQDHLGFMSNSNMYHSSPTQLKAAQVFSDNIEDGQWHDAKFNWNAASKTMTVTFTTTNVPLATQVFTYTGDIVNTLFGGDPMVYWGFTASTGSIVANVHGVCIQTPPTTNCTPGRTQTPGGWGSPPNGNNPGSYLHANFASGFPGGLTVGKTSNGKYAKFTSAQAITDYLPAGGKAAALTTFYVNPATNALKNNLVNHLVALTLSVGFDQYDPNFSSSGTALGNMVIKNGPFANWTVANFLAEANNILAGTPTGNKTVEDALNTASAINENYVDGTTDNGYLKCPAGSTPPQERSVSPLYTATENVQRLGTATVSPNPTLGRFDLRLNNQVKGTAQINVVNGYGMPVERRSVQLFGENQILSFDLSKQSSGIYFIQVLVDGKTQTHRVVVTR